MIAHQFLTEEWIQAARELRAEYADRIPTVAAVVRANQVVTGVPFGESVVMTFLDTSSGHLEFELGALENADATVTLTYELARRLIVEADFQAVMSGFMEGKVTIQGDMMKLIALVNQPGMDPTTVPEVAEMQQRLRAITA